MSAKRRKRVKFPDPGMHHAFSAYCRFVCDTYGHTGIDLWRFDANLPDASDVHISPFSPRGGMWFLADLLCSGFTRRQIANVAKRMIPLAKRGLSDPDTAARFVAHRMMGGGQ